MDRLISVLTLDTCNPFDMLIRLFALVIVPVTGRAQTVQQITNGDNTVTYNCPATSTIEAAYQDYCASKLLRTYHQQSLGRLEASVTGTGLTEGYRSCQHGQRGILNRHVLLRRLFATSVHNDDFWVFDPRLPV